MERSTSFDESMEHPVPSHQNMLRSTSLVTQSDVTKFFQCLPFDPKVVASDHKSIRQADFKQLVYSAHKIQGHESPSGSRKRKLMPSGQPEKIKELKAILLESNVKAREFSKKFNEASSLFNKCFPSVHTNKISQLEGLSGGCSGDHLASGSGLDKIGIQGQTLADGFELDQQKLGERQSGVPLKRTRSSRMGVRSSIDQQLVAANRDKEITRVANHKAVPGEDQTSIGIDGWEKSIICDDFNSSDFSNTKTNVSVHGLKPGSGLPPKLSPQLSPGVQNTRSSSKWGISGCTIKPPASAGVTDRKCTGSNRSSLGLATQSTVQKPQKISCVTRTNLPIVSCNDEVPNSDDVNPGSTETGFGFSKSSPAASPQLKLQGENNFSPADLSESEECEPPEIKSNEKEKQFDGKAAQNNPKVSISSLQSRKNNKPVASEKIGNGVRRQGRTGRGFSSKRSLNPTGEEKRKIDRIESKVGRAPARKPLNRRTNNCQKVMATDSSTRELQDSDIGREDLIAVANAAVDSAQNSPNSIWKQMGHYICSVSDDHINSLKHQEELSSMSLAPVQASSDIGSRELSHEELATNIVDSKRCPLYQMLLSAMIPEDSISIDEDLQADGLGGMNDLDNSEFNVSKNFVDSNGCRNNERVELDESEEVGSAIPFEGVVSSAHELELEERIFLELRSVGIYVESMPSLISLEDDELVEEIKKQEEAICKEGSKKKEMVNKLLNPAIKMKELQEKEFDQLGCDKLMEKAYEKHQASRRRPKNSNNKISEQVASAFTTKTLELCKTGKSCVSEPKIKEMPIAGLTRTEDTVMDDGCNPSATTPMDSQPSPAMPATENCDASPDLQLSESALPEQTTGKDDTTRSSRAKKKELLINDVGIGTPPSSSIKRKRSENCAASPEQKLRKDYTTRSSWAKKKEMQLVVNIGAPLSSCIKRTRSENYASSPVLQPSESTSPEQKPGKDDTTRSNRAKNKELLLDDAPIVTPLLSSIRGKRSGRGRGRYTQNGRLSMAKGGRKPKANQRQKTSKVSLSVSLPDQPEPVEANGINAKGANECTDNLGRPEEPEDLDLLLDFSKLEIPEFIGYLDDIEAPQDISSWLPDENTMEVDG